MTTIREEERFRASHKSQPSHTENWSDMRQYDQISLFWSLSKTCLEDVSNYDWGPDIVCDFRGPTNTEGTVGHKHVIQIKSSCKVQTQNCSSMGQNRRLDPQPAEEHCLRSENGI